MLVRPIAVLLISAMVWCAAASKASAVPFAIGDFVTYDQQAWGSVDTTASQLLAAHMDAFYSNGVEIGIPGANGSSALFTTLEAVLNFLPQGGEPSVLTNDYLDPSTTTSGQFGGYVMALGFDVDFNDARLLGGTSAVPFGDLLLFGLIETSAYNGMAVRQFLAAINTALGGGGAAYDFNLIANLTDELTRAFDNGTPSQFAQDHLTLPAQPVPEPATWALALLGLALFYFGGRTRCRQLSFCIAVGE